MTTNMQPVDLTIRDLGQSVRVTARCVYRGIDTGSSSHSRNVTLYDVSIGGIELDGTWSGDARHPILADCTLEQAEAIFGETRPKLARRIRREMARRALIADRRAARKRAQ